MCKPHDGKDAVTTFPLSLVTVAALQLADDRPAEPIRCAECGCGDIHIIAAGIEQQGELNLTTGSEDIRVSFPHNPNWRGSAVVTIYHCELGHRWAEIARFHKGQTLRSIVMIDFLPCGELWRD